MINNISIRKAKARKKPIKEKGNLIVEFVFLLPLLPMLGAVGVSCYMTVLTAWINDSCCRDACRAAAQQMTAEDAQLAANAACKRFASGSEVGLPQLSLAAGDFEYETFANDKGQPTLERGPYVKITTIVNRLPITAFIGDGISFKRSYIYPLVNNSGSASRVITDNSLAFNNASDTDGNDNK